MNKHGQIIKDCLLLLFLTITFVASAQTDEWQRKTIPGEHNICSFDSAHIESVDKKQNITSPDYPQSYPAYNSYRKLCRVRLTSCSSCKFKLVFKQVILPVCASSVPAYTGCLPGCDHLFVYDSDYPRSTIRHFFNVSSPPPFISLSNSIYVGFCNSHRYISHNKKFLIEYQTLYKQEVYSGDVVGNGSVGVFTSPNFPWGYRIRSEVFRYLIVNVQNRGLVRLTFDDWVLSKYSKITIYDGGNESSKVLFTRHGHERRPTVLSSGPKLFLLFSTGKDMYTHNKFVGFSAVYQFVTDKVWPGKPFSQGCGGFLSEQHAGLIKFDGKTCWPTLDKDCLWVVSRSLDLSYSWVSLRIQDFYSYSGYSYLEIRAGNSSRSPLIGLFTSRNLTSYEFVNHDGFYIRLRARCTHEKRLSIVFASFSNITSAGRCPSPEQFACNNGRCIHHTYSCDGVNHCGDWSDETSCSTTPVMTGGCLLYYLCQDNPAERYCASQRCDGLQQCNDGSDEFFCVTTTTTMKPAPKQEYHSSSLYPYWGMYIPVGIVCCLLMIITCVIISCYTQRLRRRSRRRARSNIPSVSRHISSNGRRTDTRVSINVEIQHGDYPANREMMGAPPTYDDAMRYDHVAGSVNWGFMSANSSENMQLPPAYNSVEFNNSIAVEPMRQPIIMAQRALLAAPGGHNSSRALTAQNVTTISQGQNRQQIGYSDASMLEIARNLAAIGHGDIDCIRSNNRPAEPAVNSTGQKEENTQQTIRNNVQQLSSTPADGGSAQTTREQPPDFVSDLDTNFPSNMASASAFNCDSDFSRKPVDIPPSVVDDGLDNLGFLRDTEATGGYASDSSSSLGSEPRVIDDSSSDSASVFMNSMSFRHRSMYMRDTSDSSDDGQDEEDEDIADTYNLTPIDIQELQEEMVAVGSQRRQHQQCDTSSV